MTSWIPDRNPPTLPITKGEEDKQEQEQEVRFS
jgi:hypothetical protein